MRERIKVAIEAMVATLDAIDAPMADIEPDDEGDGDDEPYLGATEYVNQNVAWQPAPDWIWSTDGELSLGAPENYSEYRDGAFGSRDEGEIGLGSPEPLYPNDQTFRDSTFDARDDREEHEDDERSLGSPEPLRGGAWREV